MASQVYALPYLFFWHNLSVASAGLGLCMSVSLAQNLSSPNKLFKPF